jgi:hypothetical protein
VPSPFSNVVACLALFVALGGSVYAAGKINGKQIKRNSLPGNRLKPKSVTANRIKPKALTGRQVKPRSLTGRQIDQGTLDEVSAARLGAIHYRSTAVLLPPTGWPVTRATADCPPGTSVIGGGATLSRDEGRIDESGPTPLRSGWTASGVAWFSGTTMTVTAICVAVDKPTDGSQTVSAPPSGPQYQSAP